MRRRLVMPALLLLTACKAQLGGDPVNHENTDAQPEVDAPDQVDIDAAIDGTPGLGPWGTPAKVPGADTTAAEDDATMSSNTLEIYFKRVDADGANLYVMTRASATSNTWSAPTALTILNTTTADEESPRLTSNDLTMYFGRGGDIYKSTRASTTSPWTAATLVTTLSTTGTGAVYEKWAAVCDTGYAIVSRAVTGRGQDFFEGTVSTNANTALDGLNTTTQEQGTFLSADCLTLYFQSNRDGSFDIFMSTRATTTSAWGAPVKLADFNTTTGTEEDPWISTDQKTFTFTNSSSGNKDVYIVTR